MKNILIIEDDSALTTGLCRALSSGEIHTAGCHCLREARTMLQQEVYALILLDVNLPDGSGCAGAKKGVRKRMGDKRYLKWYNSQ